MKQASTLLVLGQERTLAVDSLQSSESSSIQAFPPRLARTHQYAFSVPFNTMITYPGSRSKMAKLYLSATQSLDRHSDTVTSRIWPDSQSLAHSKNTYDSLKDFYSSLSL